jgi:hypothetical protein
VAQVEAEFCRGPECQARCRLPAIAPILVDMGTDIYPGELDALAGERRVKPGAYGV